MSYRHLLDEVLDECSARLELLMSTRELGGQGREPSTFRFSVGGISLYGYHYDPVCNVFMSKSLQYDPLRTVVLRYVCDKLVIRVASMLSRL
jgi:hypothetical protein